MRSIRGRAAARAGAGGWAPTCTPVPQARPTDGAPREVPPACLVSEEARLGWIRDNAKLLGNTRPHLVGHTVCQNMVIHGSCFKADLCWFRHDAASVQAARKVRSIIATAPPEGTGRALPAPPMQPPPPASCGAPAVRASCAPAAVVNATSRATSQSVALPGGARQHPMPSAAGPHQRRQPPAAEGGRPHQAAQAGRDGAAPTSTAGQSSAPSSRAAAWPQPLQRQTSSGPGASPTLQWHARASAGASEASCDPARAEPFSPSSREERVADGNRREARGADAAALGPWPAAPRRRAALLPAAFANKQSVGHAPWQHMPAGVLRRVLDASSRRRSLTAAPFPSDAVGTVVRAPLVPAPSSLEEESASCADGHDDCDEDHHACQQSLEEASDGPNNEGAAHGEPSRLGVAPASLAAASSPFARLRRATRATEARTPSPSLSKAPAEDLADCTKSTPSPDSGARAKAKLAGETPRSSPALAHAAAAVAAKVPCSPSAVVTPRNWRQGVEYEAALLVHSVCAPFLGAC